MKYAAVITLLAAIGAAGCGGPDDETNEQADKTESKKELSPEAIAAEARRIMETARTGKEPKPVGKPAFFGGASSGTREDKDVIETTQPATPVEPVKPPPPRLVKPGAQAERLLRLAKLYIANAASAPSPIQRKFLSDKAVGILKEIISKHPQNPAATEANKLLAEIETTQ
jgi:hypothetical protein